MASSSPKASGKGITLYSSDTDLRQRLAAKLAERGTYAVKQADARDFLALPPAIPAPRLIVLDMGDGSILEDPRLAEAWERRAGIPIIALSADMTPERVRSLVRLRASDWLQRPFTEVDFMSALTQVEGGAAAADSRVTTILGASGGAGATTLALMAARHLAQYSAAGEFCLMDLDFQSASTGAYLNALGEFDLDSLIDNPDRLDREVLELIELHHKPGITLYSFERPDLVFAPTGKRFVLRLLDLVAARHREVVIDLPNLRTPWFDDVIKNSNFVFVVFEINVPSLRQARRTLTHIHEVRGSWEGVVGVGSKAGFKFLGNAISRKDVAKMLGDVKPHFLPRDDELVTDALNRALLPSEVSPRAHLVREASRLFTSVLGKRRPRA